MRVRASRRAESTAASISARVGIAMCVVGSGESLDVSVGL